MDTLSRNDQRAILAELLGTMFFVIVGTGSVAMVGNANDPVPTLLVISLAHGIGILTAVAWTAGISGGHINPAVTLAMIITNNIKPVLGTLYIVGQLVGAAVGALLVIFYLPNAIDENVGVHSLSEDVASGEGLLLEIILTAFLVIVIFNTAVSKKGWDVGAPIAIGLAVAVIHLVAVPLTGASVNPARSFGPALVNNEWGDFWIYIVGPAIGAAIVAAIWMWWKNYGEDSLE
ncbi:MAG TPA: MIP family channel protein [Dehalococcoidia bacterium]|nr:MIP family channel protein [Dehalococcoidia bacterium]